MRIKKPDSGREMEIKCGNCQVLLGIDLHDVYKSSFHNFYYVRCCKCNNIIRLTDKMSELIEKQLA